MIAAFGAEAPVFQTSAFILARSLYAFCWSYESWISRHDPFLTPKFSKSSAIEIGELCQAVESTPRRGVRAAECGGLLIHPDLFGRTDFRLFCLRYELLSCATTPHLQSIVQQVFSKNSPPFSSLQPDDGIPGCQPRTEFAPTSINRAHLSVLIRRDESTLISAQRFPSPT